MATSNPIQPIQPVNLPSSAAINYGEGDVRHFGQGDDVSVPGLSNPTRQLAERDNRLAAKLNEVIANVNNQEQFVPLPIVRTILPPNDQTTVLNYRIPPGFESRVLDASISAAPTSEDIELDIFYSTSFGASTGTQVVTTSGEFTGGVNFYQTGEFIVVLKNKGGSTLELMASILLTLRPLGAQGSLLVGSIIEGPQGLPGQKGDPGLKGEPGSGGIGSPGMAWAGSWAPATPYQPTQVVRYDLGGVGLQVSSFMCKTANTGQVPSLTSSFWEPIAIGGAAGTPGGAGPTGPSGSFTLAAEEKDVQGTLTTGSPFIGGVYNADYSSNGLSAPNQTLYFPMREVFIGTNTPASQGVAFLTGNFKAFFTGWGTITLPKKAYGAKADYTNTEIACGLSANGTVPVEVVGAGTQVRMVQFTKSSSDQYAIYVPNVSAVPLNVILAGGAKIS